MKRILLLVLLAFAATPVAGYLRPIPPIVTEADLVDPVRSHGRLL